MENEQNTELEQLNTENEGDVVEVDAESDKPKLTPEQIKGIKKRQLTKLAKELGIALDKPESAPQKEQKTGFGYAEKAFLKASGIKSDEFDMVFEIVQETGKDIEQLIDSKWFQAELKELRDQKTVKDAIPKDSKRSGTNPRTEVDYWLAKGELPPADQTELRRKVLNEKIRVESRKNKFSTRPIM